MVSAQYLYVDFTASRWSVLSWMLWSLSLPICFFGGLLCLVLLSLSYHVCLLSSFILLPRSAFFVFLSPIILLSFIFLLCSLAFTTSYILFFTVFFFCFFPFSFLYSFISTLSICDNFLSSLFPASHSRHESLVCTYCVTIISGFYFRFFFLFVHVDMCFIVTHTCCTHSHIYRHTDRYICTHTDTYW